MKPTPESRNTVLGQAKKGTKVGVGGEGGVGEAQNLSYPTPVPQISGSRSYHPPDLVSSSLGKKGVRGSNLVKQSKGLT